VVIATHDVHLIEQFKSRRIVLGDGRIDANTQSSTAPSAQPLA
jgi:ABC-type ATPase involved in cell division